MKNIENFENETFIGKNINLKTTINNQIMYLFLSKIISSVSDRSSCISYDVILDPNKKTKILITKGFRNNSYFIKSVDDNHYLSKRLVGFNKVCGDNTGDIDEFGIEDNSGKILIYTEGIIAGKPYRKYIGSENNKLIFVDDKMKAINFEYVNV